MKGRACCPGVEVVVFSEIARDGLQDAIVKVLREAAAEMAVFDAKGCFVIALKWETPACMPGRENPAKTKGNRLAAP
jgi:hypothetical protein